MPGFDHFVILADMRTGSNLLEERLNAYPGLRCHGEVFNPRFVGHEGQDALLGVTRAARDRDPLALVARLRAEGGGLGGFRLFPGHDPRVLAHCLAAPGCAKIVLSRNPVDSYVSLGIARATGQWWLGDDRTARRARMRFDAQAFAAHLHRLQDFYGGIRRALQASGQTAFHIHYDDLGQTDILDGLARWLGSTGPADPSGPAARVQNPEPIEDKVENFAEMAAALGPADAYDLYRLPDFEPRRGPNVPGWLASEALGLLFLPLAGGPTAEVSDWMTAAAGAPPVLGLTRKDLRHWQRAAPGRRSFTVVTHPLARAHRVFVEKILDPGPDGFHDIRQTLRDRYGLPMPEGRPDATFTRQDHRAAFAGFLRFLKANLAGQTAVRVPAAWSSQAELVRAFSELVPPDAILRAEALEADLPRLHPGAPPPLALPAALHGTLAEVYDAEIEAAAQAAFRRDYLTFGYGDWR